MKYYSQKDPNWKNIKVGFGNQNCYSVGCFLCSLSMMAEIEPPKVNELLKEKGGYSGNLIISEKAAEALGLEYNGVYSNPVFPCIMETDHYKSKGVPQHFVVMTDEKHILDPLDYPVEEKKNPYHIVSYRLFNQPNQNNMYDVKSDLKNAIQKITGNDYGKVVNEDEQKQAAEDLDTYRKTCESYKSLAEEYHTASERFALEADEFESELEICRDDLKQSRATTSGYVEKVRELNAEIVKLNQEIKDLKENSPAYNLIKRLKDAIIDLINFK